MKSCSQSEALKPVPSSWSVCTNNQISEKCSSSPSWSFKEVFSPMRHLTCSRSLRCKGPLGRGRSHMHRLWVDVRIIAPSGEPSLLRTTCNADIYSCEIRNRARTLVRTHILSCDHAQKGFGRTQVMAKARQALQTTLQLASEGLGVTPRSKPGGY